MIDTFRGKEDLHLGNATIKNIQIERFRHARGTKGMAAKSASAIGNGASTFGRSVYDLCDGISFKDKCEIEGNELSVSR